MDTVGRKRGILWWIGRIILWIVFFPIMLFLFLVRSKKIPVLVKLPLLALYVGALAFGIKEGVLRDRIPPVIEAKAASAGYGSTIELSELASISDAKDENPQMTITYCDPKVGTIGEDGQTVTFDKVGNYIVKVTGQDSAANVTEAEISVSITDGTAPVISAEKKEFDIQKNIQVSDIATAKDEIDDKPEITIIACDGNAEIAKGGKSIVFKATGDYTVGVMASDASRNSVKEKLAVKIRNNTAPDAAGNKARQEAKVTVRQKPAERTAPAPETPADPEPEVGTPEQGGAASTYILNKNTGKFHHPGCKSVKQMKENNKIYFEGTRDEVIEQGYEPCQNCNP